jgi:hypothetical protein
VQRQATATDARHALLAGLIDHAALFPPASMSMRDALAEDRRARAGGESFLLGRFVCPASRVAELGDEARALSVVLDAPVPEDERIESVELRHPGELTGLNGLARDVYVELPVDGIEELPSLAALRLRAKVRCGGERVPTRAELAGFVRECRRHQVPFKATAGLHHALPTGDEHGFLNLLAAVVFGEEEAALAEEDSAAFALDGEVFRWRHRGAGPEELAHARERFHAIGSCSFAEPVAELVALGVLPLV